MEEITIYKFQLEAIEDALRITSRLHNSRTGETCFDRQVRQSEQYVKNSLEGNYKTRVNYITGKNE
tara:strand:- start:2876 stop:3073 length:198 start_codon:yes stop_codon:yes gene_type:complete